MKLRALLIFAALSFVSPAFAQLTSTDVDTIVRHAAVRGGKISPNSVIAVTDREGYVLGVWVVRGGNANPDEIATAVSKAGTAAFLSSNQNAFTSRTAGFIIQQHFPPGVSNTATGPLVTMSTPRHNPMFLSGGAGFQSTNVMARSLSVGEKISTANTFCLPGRAASVILNS